MSRRGKSGAAGDRVEREAPAPAAYADLPRAAISSPAASRNAASRRDYKLFVPPQAGERALPLVVMLHGCTQNPDDFAAGTAMNEAALAQGFFVLYPAQSQQANPQRCWNWFKHSHQKRGRGEPALLAGMTREVMAQPRASTRGACTWRACRPAARWRRSWARPIRTCLRRSACTPAWRPAPRPTCRRRWRR